MSIPRTCIWMIGASAAALASAASAQDASPADAGADELIVVTGSRVARPEVETPSPVISLDAETLQASGTTNVTDFLSGYPALVGSSGSTENSGVTAGVGSTGLNLLNLRNLGVQRTLVLVDGRRHVAGVPGAQSVDINTIPSDLIERVDILTGGVSAVYGADGVTGVVNFVLKRDFEGISARGQAGISEHGDAGQRLGSVTAGTNFAGGRGNVALAYEFSQEDRLESSDRERLRGGNFVRFSMNPLDGDTAAGHDGVPDFVPLRDVRFFNSARSGAIDLDFDGIPEMLGTGEIFDRGSFVPNAYQQGGSGTLVADFGSDLLPRIERHSVNAIAHFDVSDALTIFAEGKYANVESYSLGQPTYDYFLFIQEYNPYIPDPVRAAILPGGGGFFLNRDNFDLGRRGERIERETYRAVAGARGDVGPGLHYELSYVFGRTDIKADYLGDILDDRFYAAIDVANDPVTGQPNCLVNFVPGYQPFQPFVTFYSDPAVREVVSPTTFAPGDCRPLNLFGDGAPSQEAIDFITADTRDVSRIEQHVVSGVVSGEIGRLPGGDIGFAVGAEYRKEKSRFTPDALASQGLTFANAQNPTRGSFNVKEAFAEVRVPILADVPGAERLEVGGAVRFSDYSTIGSTTTWRLDGAWAPVRAVTFNGTYSKAIRAPNIGELFSGGQVTYASIIDPCNFNQLQNGSATRAANCATLLGGLGADPTTFIDNRPSQVRGLQAGNPDLEEEEATTWTAGVAFQPRFVPGLTVRADWYDIELENAVSYVNPQQAVNLCVDEASLDNPYCNLFNRQSGGPAAGFLSQFSVIPQNVAAFETAGLDLNVNYRFDAGSLGRFDVSMVGNYLDKLETVGVAGSAPISVRGTANVPKYQANLDVSWRRGPVTVNYGLSWFDKTSRYDRATMENNPDVVAPEYLYYKERWVHDIYASVDVGDNFQLYGGVNNVFGQRPSIGVDSYPVSSVGRFFFAGARVRLPSF